jgi:hypothetical protein
MKVMHGSYTLTIVSTVAVGTLVTERPRTDPYKRVYAYGSYVASTDNLAVSCSFHTAQQHR